MSRFQAGINMTFQPLDDHQPEKPGRWTLLPPSPARRVFIAVSGSQISAARMSTHVQLNSWCILQMRNKIHILITLLTYCADSFIFFINTVAYKSTEAENVICRLCLAVNWSAVRSRLLCRSAARQHLFENGEVVSHVWFKLWKRD